MPSPAGEGRSKLFRKVQLNAAVPREELLGEVDPFCFLVQAKRLRGTGGRHFLRVPMTALAIIVSSGSPIARMSCPSEKITSDSPWYAGSVLTRKSIQK